MKAGSPTRPLVERQRLRPRLHPFVFTPQAVTLGIYDRLAASKLTFALGTMSVYFTLGGA